MLTLILHGVPHAAHFDHSTSETSFPVSVKKFNYTKYTFNLCGILI